VRGLFNNIGRWYTDRDRSGTGTAVRRGAPQTAVVRENVSVSAPERRGP